jgi:hypothetical protein
MGTPKKSSADKPRKRAPGAGRKPKLGYVKFPTVRIPLEAVERIKDAQRVGQSLGETIARAFGWEPPSRG